MIKQKKWAQTRKKQTYSLISQNTMQLNYCLFFFIREFSSLDVRSQVISPPETATLSTSFESYIYMENNIAKTSVRLYIIEE
jgi:hypothetical protein